MDAVRDIIITGLLLGGIFALVSVGLSLEYGVGRVLNVAHGEFIMLGAFITFWLTSSYNLNALADSRGLRSPHLCDRLVPSRDSFPALDGIMPPRSTFSKVRRCWRRSGCSMSYRT